MPLFAGMLRFAMAAMALLAASCEESKIDTPERNFERPVDVAFFCAGPVQADSDLWSALGADLCDTSFVWCEGSDDQCEETLASRRLFALVLNSVRGELGLLDVDRKRIVDLVNHQPGYSFVPVGTTPTAVGVSPDGCAAVTLNAGSCDFSVVDTTRLLEMAGADTTRGIEHTSVVKQVSFLTDSGKLAARPSEIIMAPGESWPPPVKACGDLLGYRAYVSFPSCALVAEVDLDSGKILQSFRVSASGVEDTGTDPVCPSQCPSVTGDVVDGGELSQDRPGHLDYGSFAKTGGSPTLYIAPDRGSYVAMVDLTPEGEFNLLSARVVQLEGIRNGIRSVSLSPLSPPPNDWQFLYVTTRDGDIRVVDVTTQPEVECETNPDPRDPLFETENWRQSYASCIPLDEEVMRSPMRETPGIELPSGRSVVDVAFTVVDATGYEGQLDVLDPLRLNGMFAYAVALDGVAYVINVDERFDPSDGNENGVGDQLEARLEDGIHAVISHQIRNITDTRSTEQGSPRAEEPFTYYSEGTVIEEPPAGITLEMVTVDDPRLAVDESWRLTYEGILPDGSRPSGYVVQPNPAVDDPDSATLRDSGSQGFCKTGVEVGDRLIIKGCEFDDDCPEGFACLENPRDAQETGGVCLDARYAKDESVGRACLALAQGKREYEVLDAHDDELIFGVTLAPGTLCDGPEDCGGDGRPSSDYVCEEGRCALDCSETDGNGKLLEDCASVEGICSEGRCIHAPLPDRRVDISGEVTWCMPALVSYELRASGAYLVKGSTTGSLVARVADPNLDGLCVEDPEASPLVRFRMAPTPDTFSNPILSLALGGTENSRRLDREDGISFNLIAGFDGMGLDLSCRLPAVAVTAVDGNIYVIDMGDDVETAGGVAGQVVRILPPEVSLDVDFLIR